MKQSMKSVCSMFNTSRQVQQYAEEFYMPASATCIKLVDQHGQGAKDLAKWQAQNGRAIGTRSGSST